MFRASLAAGAALMALAPGMSVAASQIMGLVATTEPIPMQCAQGRCTALLSTFCLQEKRLPPDFDSAYRPAEEGQVILVAETTDGRELRLPADGLVAFRTRYGYTAVEAALDMGAFEGEAPISLALQVMPRAALLPLLIAGDSDPLSTAEIATATGPWRLSAASIFEGNGEIAESARTLMRLVNALPDVGDIVPDAREGLWKRVTGKAPILARQVFDACTRAVDQAVGYSMRKCLEERHERLQVENTREFWRSLGGS